MADFNTSTFATRHPNWANVQALGSILYQWMEDG